MMNTSSTQCESLPSLKGGKQILYFGDGGVVQLGHWINCHLEIATYLHSLVVALQYSYDRSCPIRIVRRFQCSLVY